MTVELKDDENVPTGSVSNQPVNTSQPTKVDRITALQDAVDSLSLAMFEALRGLRDAVAPESGNLGGNTDSNENSEPDFEDFWQSYRNGDPETLAIVKKVSPTTPQKREDLIRIYDKVELMKDAELVKELASTVLEKSEAIDERVSGLPGMHRTRAEQMEYIEALLIKNKMAAQKLGETYEKAQERRDQVRAFVRRNTCTALGIVEDED